MSFEIVQLGEIWVAGLPVRSPKRALGRLTDPNLEAAWSAVLNQDIGGSLASIYTDYATGIGSYNTQIVGYRTEPGDVRRGHIVAKIPAGSYAKFSAVGSFPNIMTTLWSHIERAEEAKEFTRTFTGEYEFYPHAYKIEMYLPIVAGGSRP
jgi:predicted transcriptional regulator YdeE